MPCETEGLGSDLEVEPGFWFCILSLYFNLLRSLVQREF